MRRLAFLLPLAILIIAAGLLGTYRVRLARLRADAPEKPALLASDLSSSATGWEWGKNQDGKPQVQIKAEGSRFLKGVNKLELDGVELKLFQKDGEHYDRVKSPKAVFSQSEGKMFSDGEVEITLSVPVKGNPPHPLTSIKSTGITFDSKTGKADTGKPATFKFENGNGSCVGVSYDPDTHELHMNSQVDVNLNGKGKRSKAMHVQTETMVYQENGSKITLGPWSKLIRDNTVVDAGGSIINLKDKLLNTIDADHAHGVDSYPKRHLNYAADMLHLSYNDDGELEKMTGMGNAHLTSESKGSETTVKASNVDMYFESENGENVLRRAIANGNGSVEAKPEPQPNGKFAETKVIHAETIEMKMRKGGHELEQVETRVPSTLELLPNQPSQHHRILHGANMTILYGQKNQLQSFASTKVSTDTYPLPPPAPKPGQKPKAQTLQVAHTSSENMTAEFDPKSGNMKRMKQWGQFDYEEGERHATGETAFLENDTNIMDIDKNARVWDASGSTNGDHIKLAQSTGDFNATGHVSTTRLPEQKKNASAMLDDDEPTQGIGEHVWSTDKNKVVHYEGHAVVWQTSNRIDGDRIDIDRNASKKILIATGNVVTEFLDQDKSKPAAGAKPNANQVAGPASAAITKPSASGSPLAAPAAPKPGDKPLIYTIVHAAKLVYTDDNRLANYTGGVVLTRPNMTVKGKELQAFLNPKDSGDDSRLNHAVAEGGVEISEKAPDRTRTGKGNHGEYYTEDSRIVLRGALAQMVDSKKGEINGLELTYYSDDDRLHVKGAPAQRVSSTLHRKH
jgi:lipopolysaccharide export system protein LptA